MSRRGGAGAAAKRAANWQKEEAAIKRHFYWEFARIPLPLLLLLLNRAPRERRTAADMETGASLFSVLNFELVHGEGDVEGLSLDAAGCEAGGELHADLLTAALKARMSGVGVLHAELPMAAEFHLETSLCVFSRSILFLKFSCWLSNKRALGSAQFSVPN